MVSNVRVRGRKFATEAALRWLYLELRGLKVLPPPDLDDGESLWIGPGAAQPRQCSGAGSRVLAGATDGGGRLLCHWS